MSSPQLDPQTLIMTVSEDRVFGFSVADAPEVKAAATVSSVAMIPATVSGITFGAPGPNTSQFDDIPANQGGTVEITAANTGTYNFAAKLTLSTGKKLVVPCVLNVAPDHN